MLAGASLRLQLRPGPNARRAGLLCAVAALVIAVVVSPALVIPLDLGFHRGLSLLLGYSGDDTGLRMSLHAALMLAGTATALVMVGQSHRRECCPVSIWLANLAIRIQRRGAGGGGVRQQHGLHAALANFEPSLRRAGDSGRWHPPGAARRPQPGHCVFPQQ